MNGTYLEVKVEDGEAEVNLLDSGKVELRFFDSDGNKKTSIQLNKKEICELIEALEYGIID